MGVQYVLDMHKCIMVKVGEPKKNKKERKYKENLSIFLKYGEYAQGHPVGLCVEHDA